METIGELLKTGAAGDPALIGIEPALTLTYAELRDQIARLTDELAAAGLPAQSRVAMLLPNGPEFVAIFLALLGAGLTAAPYNPAQSAELPTLWRDAEVRAVIAPAVDRAAQAIAAQAGLPRWAASLEAGAIRLTLPRTSKPTVPPTADSIGLFLHTSGTTSKPKGVPLTHRNLMASIANIAAGYQLSPADRTLLSMPLFHVHGLIGATLSTLSSGGTVIAPPRFSASAFWPLAQTHRATWYSAVPTIHRTLLMRAEADAPARSGFRFIRSCSAALAPAMLAQMESRFDAPVLEAYGMTEASHQIACNPLPPAPHKAGSVGIGGRVDVAILDDAGNKLPSGMPGEVAIKGPNVMSGYDRNPAANAAAFINGYLRTGDRGVIDADAYISLIGRIKELINRGGEKISPAEIDAILLAHPAVAEAAAFGVADDKYGEEVAAAVVLRAEASEHELHAHCRERLADFKAPKSFHIVSELPKTATGKVQRSTLAAQLRRP